MDSFFGIGAAELVVILLLAGIVLGPQRLRKVAFWLGRVTAQLQSISRGFARQLNEELSALDEGYDAREAASAVQDMRQQVEELMAMLRPLSSPTAGLATKQPAAESDRDLLEALSALRATMPQAAELADGQPDSSQSPRNGLQIAVPRPIEVTDDPEQ